MGRVGIGVQGLLWEIGFGFFRVSVGVLIFRV